MENIFYSNLWQIKTIEHVKKQVIDTIPQKTILNDQNTVQKVVETVTPVPPPISENVVNIQENIQEKVETEIKKP